MIEQEDMKLTVTERDEIYQELHSILTVVDGLSARNEAKIKEAEADRALFADVKSRIRRLQSKLGAANGAAR